MRLILLTLPNAKEPVSLDALFETGLQTLHVRKPDWTCSQVRAYLQCVSPQYHRRLVLHSCHELGAEFDIGVRLRRVSCRASEHLCSSTSVAVQHLPAHFDCHAALPQLTPHCT